jgi:hypothetical protein
MSFTCTVKMLLPVSDALEYVRITVFLVALTLELPALPVETATL